MCSIRAFARAFYSHAAVCKETVLINSRSVFYDCHSQNHNHGNFMITNDLAIRHSATISDKPSQQSPFVFDIADAPVSDVAQRALPQPSKSIPRKAFDAVVFCASRCAHFAASCFKVVGTVLERIADVIFYPAQRVYTTKQTEVAVQIREETEAQQRKAAREKAQAEQLKKDIDRRGQVKLREIAQRRDQRLADRAQMEARRAALAAGAAAPAPVAGAASLGSSARSGSPSDGEFLCTVVLAARARLARELAEVNAKIDRLTARLPGSNEHVVTQGQQEIIDQVAEELRNKFRVDAGAVNAKIEKLEQETPKLRQACEDIRSREPDSDALRQAQGGLEKNETDIRNAKQRRDVLARDLQQFMIQTPPQQREAVVKIFRDRKETVTTFAEAINPDAFEMAEPALFDKLPVLVIEHVMRSKEAPTDVNTPPFLRHTIRGAFARIQALFNDVVADNPGRDLKVISVERYRAIIDISSPFTRRPGYGRQGWDSTDAIQDCARRLAAHAGPSAPPAT
jgi:hypothetical protein